jgi:serine/threonine protein kinase
VANLDVKMPDGLEAVSVLGKGAMGIVYKAWQEKLKRHLAVKTCFIKESEEVGQDVARLEDEALTIAQLNHPNIVSLIDVFRDDVAIYLIMEYLDGPPLSKLLNPNITPAELGEYATTLDNRMGRTLREDWILEIGLAVGKALSYAHSRKVLHRDIKPANIIITEAMNVKLLDFSIARNSSQSEGRTIAGTVFGTVQYMSPEQILSHPMDGRTDIYSLGCTLYHLATGEPVFSDPNDITVCMNHVNTPPKPILNRNPHLSTETAALIMKCLEKDPKDRFRTADDMVEQLKRILRNLGSGHRLKAVVAEVSPSTPNKFSANSPTPLHDLETREETGDTGVLQFPLGRELDKPGSMPTPLPRNPSRPNTPEIDSRDQSPKPGIKPLSSQNPQVYLAPPSAIKQDTPQDSSSLYAKKETESVMLKSRPERRKKKLGLEELASQADDIEWFTGKETPTNEGEELRNSSSQVPGVTTKAYVPTSYTSQLIDQDSVKNQNKQTQQFRTVIILGVVGILLLCGVLVLIF